MGRSAKFAKRPTKAEKVARQINKPIASHNGRQRSLSPDLEDGPKSEIPLFNTSAKGRQYSHKPDPRKLQPATSSTVMAEDDDQAPELVDADEPEDLMDGGGGAGKKKKNLKDKMRQANQAIERDQEKTERKLGAKYKKGGKPPILGGKDYVKMLESRPGGAFKHKKLR